MRYNKKLVKGIIPTYIGGNRHGILQADYRLHNPHIHRGEPPYDCSSRVVTSSPERLALFTPIALGRSA